MVICLWIDIKNVCVTTPQLIELELHKAALCVRVGVVVTVHCSRRKGTI